jgi:transposase-like protein
VISGRRSCIYYGEDEMKYEQGVTEWHFVTSYCPVCGSQRIETEGGPVDDFHCKDCDSLFDVMVDIETLSEKNE